MPLTVALDAPSAITSSVPDELKGMMLQVQALRAELGDDRARPSRIGLEINTSCPNIPGHPPPSYEPRTAFPALLGPLLEALPESLTLGLKLPPYTHAGQFADLLAFLELAAEKTPGSGRIAYLACCNTLGGCLGFDSGLVANAGAQAAQVGALDVDRFAGMAGASLHPLALGCVVSPPPSLRVLAQLVVADLPHARVCPQQHPPPLPPPRRVARACRPEDRPDRHRRRVGRGRRATLSGGGRDGGRLRDGARDEGREGV